MRRASRPPTTTKESKKQAGSLSAIKLRRFTSTGFDSQRGSGSHQLATARLWLSRVFTLHPPKAQTIGSSLIFWPGSRVQDVRQVFSGLNHMSALPKKLGGWMARDDSIRLYTPQFFRYRFVLTPLIWFPAGVITSGINKSHHVTYKARAHKTEFIV